MLKGNCRKKNSTTYDRILSWYMPTCIYYEYLVYCCSEVEKKSEVINILCLFEIEGVYLFDNEFIFTCI